MRHEVTWLAPSPLWDRSTGSGADTVPALFEPALLRFTRDAFMDEVRAVLDAEPTGVASLLARPEPAGGDLVLYQPIHSRHYLVAASLVCRAPGLPERSVDAGAEERTSFLVRRLAPRDGRLTADLADPGSQVELGWAGDAQSGGWVPLSDPLVPDPREERLALFPAVFAAGSARRRLHLGLVPSARRELYETAPGAAGAAPGVYRVRCLYERPRCRDVAAPSVSTPSTAFRLAGFDDTRLPKRDFRRAGGGG